MAILTFWVKKFKPKCQVGKVIDHEIFQSKICKKLKLKQRFIS